MVSHQGHTDFPRRSGLRPAVLTSALAAALAAAGAAQAVHINPNGSGQVLLFPFYTVRAGQNTLITLVNTQTNAKAVKVRFLEGKNSREVLDFNLFLPANDVWTGAVVATTAGARLVSNDNSCVIPNDLFTETRTDAQGLAPNEFKNAQYTGAATDAAAFASLDRTREGYFEVIEMGVIDAASVTGAAIIGYLQKLPAISSSAGVSVNCPALNAFEPSPGNTNAFRFPNVGTSLMTPPSGGLTGRASLIGAANGSNYTYSPTALDAWSDVVAYTEAGNTGPSLALASPAISMSFTREGLVTSRWANGRDAVSAALMRLDLLNEFILDNGTASQTDWIITFPTKRLHVGAGTGSAQLPFANNFPDSTTGACDGSSYAAFNRETGRDGTAIVPVFSFVPPGTVVPPPPLCWSANIVPFGTTSLVASTNTTPLLASLQSFVNNAISTPGSATSPALRPIQGPNGYVRMRFDGVAATLTPMSATLIPASGVSRPLSGSFRGLPVIGLMLQNYQNAGVASRYGGAIEHRFAPRIE